ncbi:MAG TPA: hypothetical protein VK281_00310 [Xanthobacteraceae bacterium]|nr:hypothetical protein [Xanthobacteraceae bacterium]
MDSDTFAVPEVKKPDLTAFTRPDWTVSPGKNEPFTRPVSQQDLIGADGRCANEAAAPTAEPPRALNFTAGPDASRPDRGAQGLPPAPAPVQPAGPAVGLGMSECEVVYALGHTDRMEVGGERGQRAVVLTYVQGPRPGIYRFAGGRLVSIERGQEAPAPAKPEKKTAKKPPGKKPDDS